MLFLLALVIADPPPLTKTVPIPNGELTATLTIHGPSRETPCPFAYEYSATLMSTVAVDLVVKWDHVWEKQAEQKVSLSVGQPLELHGRFVDHDNPYVLHSTGATLHVLSPIDVAFDSGTGAYTCLSPDRTVTGSLEPLWRILKAIQHKLWSPDPDAKRIRDLAPGLLASFKKMSWRGKSVAIDYQGEWPWTSTVYAPFSGYVTGLAFHPDGRLAVGQGGGSTSPVVIDFIAPDGGKTNFVTGRSTPNSMPDQTLDQLIAEGTTPFFSGPIAFDKNGQCLFSLGPFQETRPGRAPGNGAFRVISTQPARFAAVTLFGGTQQLQVPPFDNAGLYATTAGGVRRFDLTQPSVVGSEVFDIDANFSDFILLSPTRAIFTLRLNFPELQKQYVTVLVDADAHALWLVAPARLGPFALAFDAGRLVYFDSTEHSLRSFHDTQFP